MIVLDTNVVSEAMKPEPDQHVQAWLDAQAFDTLYLSTVTVTELLFGIGVLPAGRRKDGMILAIEGLLRLFASRILPFDIAAARRHADIAIRARNAGQGFPTPDGYIAAIAASRGFAVATRDASAFAAAGLAVINPWKTVR